MIFFQEKGSATWKKIIRMLSAIICDVPEMQAVWEEAEYVILCFPVFVFWDKLWEDLNVKISQQVLDIH